MNKGIFITATSTDVGKTYFSAILLKALHNAGFDCGYYKAALSGADSFDKSDAGYVNKFSGADAAVSYIYKNAVSPHLASQLERNPVCLSKVISDFKAMCSKHKYVVAEGSGGIICPIRWDSKHILLSDIIKALGLSVLIVADAGLGTINSTFLTVEYIRTQGIPIAGIVLNRYNGSIMQQDNKKMIEALCNVPVVCCIKKDENCLDANLFAPLLCEV